MTREVRPVLVVVDAQVGFVNGLSRHVVPVIQELVGRWQATGRHTVFTRFFNHPGSPYERIIGWTKMHPGDPGTELVAPLVHAAGRATAVLDKTGYTSITDDFLRLAVRHAWTDVLVCGFDTESCVLKTAVDAFEQFFTPWLIADASASHAGPAAHEAGLLVARRTIGAGHVVTAGELPLPVRPAA